MLRTIPFTGPSAIRGGARLFPALPRDSERGRRILCGFTCLQRIGKAAVTDFWVPSRLGPAVRRGWDASELGYAAEWAVVRQFDLLQEAGNFYIYPLDVTDFTRSFDYIMKMRAGGYRLSVLTVGDYVESSAFDEQEALDAKITAEIAELIHMLYLPDESAVRSDLCRQAIDERNWRLEDALPHVAMALGERVLFARGAHHQDKIAAQFMNIVEKLPPSRVTHDVAVGLALPKSAARNEWIYLAPGEKQFWQFQTAIANVFRAADQWSVSELQYGKPMGRKETPTMTHMRAYGDRDWAFHRRMAQELPYLEAA